MPATRGRTVKRETATTANGLITPNESMSSAGMLTPKREQTDFSSYSDIFQERLAGTSFRSESGYPEDIEQQRRSTSGSTVLTHH
jgi:hypothetical protein